MQKEKYSSIMLRWLVLILVSGLTFATYWFQDFMGSLKDLMNQQLDISSEEFGRIIGATTWANMLGMIILGGILIDRLGVRISGVIFGALSLLGATVTFLFADGVFGDNKTVMITGMMIGRLLFGSGLEVVCVAVTRAIVKWFKGYELALALAINVGIGRLGSALGLALGLDFAAGQPSNAIMYAGTLIAFALLMYLIFILLDRQSKTKDTQEASEEFVLKDFFKLISDKSFIFITLLCVAFYAAVFPFIQYAPDFLVNKFGFSSELPAEGRFTIFGSDTGGIIFLYVAFFIFGILFSRIGSLFKTSKTKLISQCSIVILFIGFLFYFKDIFAIWLQNGAKTASLIPMGSIIFTPIFGNYVDKHGKAATLMILGSALLIFAHLSLSVFDSVYLGYAGLFALGIAFSLVPAAMWPSVAKIIPENRLGTAYATMFTIQNWGLGLFYWGIGAVLQFANSKNLKAIELKEQTYDYTIPIFCLVILGIISVILAFYLKRADKQQGYGLE